MVFSTSASTGILQRATFFAFGDALDHTTAWTLSSMTASANEAVQEVATLIWRSSQDWQWDDTNQTDLPFATTLLDVTKQDYALPNTVFQVLSVSILNVDGDYVRIPQVDPSENGGLDLLSAGNTAGMPQSYDLVGNSIILDRLPTTAACTLAAGLKITYTREATTFTTPASFTTSDTTQPGFDEAFHKLVPLKMAYDWCLAQGDSVKCGELMKDIARMEIMLASHYGKKNEDKKVGVRPRREAYF
jgi:hypothetical protein